MGLFLLDYGAGNVRSLANTLQKLGYEFQWISSADDFANATVCERTPMNVWTAHLLIPSRGSSSLA